MKIYVVFEDIFETNAFHFENIFHGAYFKEEDAAKKASELENNYSDVYYEEIEVQ